MSLGDDLVRFVVDTASDVLPSAVKRKSKLCLLDTLGAIIAGSDLPLAKILGDFVDENWSGKDSTVVLSGKASAPGAALVNGYMANGLDVDDGGKYTRGHPGAQIIPAVLALSEKYDKTGKDVLVATAVGYETAHRVGGCWHEVFEEYRSCGSWGSVATAAASSNLVNLSAGEVRHSLAIADYNSPYLPMMKAIDKPSMVKHGTGWGAMTGIFATEWAKRGFTGSGTTFEEANCNSWFEGLGDHYVMAEENAVEFKKIPSCSWGHPAINAAIDLVNSQNIDVNEIAKIEVKGFSEMARLNRKFPESVEEAQFSVKWPLAVALVDGEVTPEGMRGNRFSDPDVRSVFDRIKIVRSTELEQLNRKLSSEVGETSAWPTRVVIETNSGSRYDSGTVLSEPEDRGNWKFIRDKFMELTGPYIGDDVAREVIEMVRNLDRIDRVDDLMSMLRESTNRKTING